jgi:hypothetical protein
MTNVLDLDTTEAERLELETVLAALRRAPKLAKLLRYLAEECFAGNAGQLTEHGIAISVFGRKGTSFIASEDSVARVETYRLRKKLKAYYETAGKDHQIQITIPLGMYTPAFTRKGTEAESPSALHGEPQDARLIVEPDLVAVPPAQQTESPQLSSNQQADLAKPAAQTSPRIRMWIYSGLFLVLLVLGIGMIRLVRWHHPSVATGGSSTGALGSVPKSSASQSNIVFANLPLRMIAGYSGPPQRDSAGDVWQADQYYRNGSPLHRANTFIEGTSDPLLYRYGRTGNLYYDIPLSPGSYELHLYFAQVTATLEPEDAVNKCVFTVIINGKAALLDLDPVSDATGLNIADERVIRDVSPDTDGILHLHLGVVIGNPFLSAIQIVSGTPGRQLPIRFTAQSNPWTDHSGQLWRPDTYFRGGRRLSHSLPESFGTDADLYGAERYGHFSYAIPVDPRDRYTVVLHMAELFFGSEDLGKGGVGSRVFRVMCNGNILLDNFDIFREAGAGKPLIKTFYHIKPTAQGKLNLMFEPIKNYATVSAIEVLDESN